MLRYKALHRLRQVSHPGGSTKLAVSHGAHASGLLHVQRGEDGRILQLAQLLRIERA